MTVLLLIAAALQVGLGLSPRLGATAAVGGSGFAWTPDALGHYRLHLFAGLDRNLLAAEPPDNRDANRIHAAPVGGSRLGSSSAPAIAASPDEPAAATEDPLPRTTPQFSDRVTAPLQISTATREGEAEPPPVRVPDVEPPPAISETAPPAVPGQVAALGSAPSPEEALPSQVRAPAESAAGATAKGTTGKAGASAQKARKAERAKKTPATAPKPADKSGGYTHTWRSVFEAN